MHHRIITIGLICGTFLVGVTVAGYQNFFHTGTLFSSEKSPDGRYSVQGYVLPSFPSDSGYIRLKNANGRTLKEVHTDSFEEGRLGFKVTWDGAYDAVEVQYSSESLTSVYWLFDPDASISKPPAYDQHRLNLLIDNGDLAAVKKMIAQGVDINKTDNAGQLPLILASTLNDGPMAELLLAHGADVNGKNAAGDTALHVSKNDGNQGPEMTQLLVEHGADINARDSVGETPLLTGVRTLSEIQYMVEHGADVRILDDDGRSVIFQPFPELDTIQYLIERGAPVDYKSPLLTKFLYGAIIAGKVDILHFFEENGTDVMPALRMHDAIYPLAYVAGEGNLAAVQYLVEHHVDVNEKDNKGLTALEEVRRWLGANIEEKTRKKLKEVETYLKEYGAT